MSLLQEVPNSQGQTSKKTERKSTSMQLRHFDDHVNLFFKVMSSKALDNILVSGADPGFF